MLSVLAILFLVIFAFAPSALAAPAPQKAKSAPAEKSIQTESVKSESIKSESSKSKKAKVEKSKKKAEKDNSRKTEKSSDKKAEKQAKKKESAEKKSAKKSDRKKDNSKKSKSKKSKRTQKKSLANDDTNTNDEEKNERSKKVTIKSDDPKAFTKALLYEKKGIEVEIVENKKKKKSKTPKIKIPESHDDFFDFSNMLIPVTHETKLGSPYGIRDHRLHRGVDIKVDNGEPMVAAFPGKVIVSRYNKGGYGHYVLVEHSNGLQTLYGHLAERAVKVGDEVLPGDIVGLAGNSGKSSGAHLHFEIRYGDVNIDPVTVVDFPHWQLKPGVEKYSKKKALQAHRKMQSKLKIENVYVVKPGDTVADVAEFFYISEDAVRRINNLGKGQPLKVGQRLKGSN